MIANIKTCIVSMRGLAQLGLAAALLLSGPLFGQALAGTYTCANGNPGNAFDYGDIGDFFNDLETHGVSAPVTLDLFDDGGPFISKDSYILGADTLLAPPNIQRLPRPVTGLNAANRLTLRAAAGELPEITGSGARHPLQATSGFIDTHRLGAICFVNVSDVTLDGLTARDSQNFGIFWYNDEPGASDRIVVCNCRVYRVSNGCAVWFRSSAKYPYSGGDVKINAVRIENNFCWGCGGGGSSVGVVGGSLSGFEWIVRNNTVVVDGAQRSAFEYRTSGLMDRWEEFSGNVIYMNPSSFKYCLSVGVSSLPWVVDYNVVYLGPNAAVCDRGTTLYTWAQWQAAGQDPNGLNVDPLLVSVAPGTEDLRLSAASPARDLMPFGPQRDIFGSARPSGPRHDAGAHEFLVAGMAVDHGLNPVAHNGIVQAGPMILPGADLGFTIRNTDQADLILLGSPRVQVTPVLNCGPGTAVSVQPPVAVLPHGASTAFTLRIEPQALGPFELTVSIASNDSFTSPYLFTVSGTAVLNLPAAARPAAGSTFSGPVNGPMLLALDPTLALTNASIELFDAEGDSITVVSITPTSPTPAGVTPPAVPAPGQPLLLTWTGSLASQNPPGDYTWQLTFHDAANGSITQCSVTIRVNNLPPFHIPATGAGAGDGSAAAPYLLQRHRGDGPGLNAALATVSDPNTSQAVSIAQVSASPANPGPVGFAFTLSAGLLQVAPAGMLTSAEIGQFNYVVELTDGVATVPAHVRIDVLDVPVLITTSAILPPGQVGTPYSATLQAINAIGATSFALVQDVLPTGLAMQSGGTIQGTPTEAQTLSFTIRCTDIAGGQADKVFTLTIHPEPAPPPSNPGQSGSGTGCTTGAGSFLWALLPLLLAFRRRRA